MFLEFPKHGKDSSVTRFISQASLQQNLETLKNEIIGCLGVVTLTQTITSVTCV